MHEICVNNVLIISTLTLRIIVINIDYKIIVVCLRNVKTYKLKHICKLYLNIILFFVN